MEAEFGVVLPQAKEYQRFLTDTKDWKKQGKTFP